MVKKHCWIVLQKDLMIPNKKVDTYCICVMFNSKF